MQCQVVNNEWCSSTAGVGRWWCLRGVTHFWVILLCPIYLFSGIHFLLCRSRTEHRIFHKLLAMVPNLLDRVVESEAELMVVAELVWVYLYKYDLIWSVVDPERSFWSKIWWHKKPERCSRRLDHPARWCFTTGHFSQCQDRPWVPSPCYRLPPLPGWSWLEWVQVSELPLAFKNLFWYRAVCARASRMTK